MILIYFEILFIVMLDFLLVNRFFFSGWVFLVYKLVGRD